ncbi:ABC transporter substrate-binding protein [Peribacillus frigoritolerans]|uniref:ABC transporter substrate-binding protein n=1 Tax=Peribacillus frigoritolerans TaxID=450367 RepID=UPI003DA0D0B2
MKKSISKIIFLCLLLALSLAACSSDDKSSDGKKSNELTVYSPHPLEFTEPLIKDFENETGIKVELISAGSGELLKRVESEKNNPLSDVFWGGSISTLDSNKELFEKFTSANDDQVTDEFKNKDGYITRFSVVPSVIMVNKNLIGDIKIEGYEDLLNKELKGKIANADPSKSSSSLEQLINQLFAMGNGDPEKGWDYVTKLIKNLDGKLLSGSSAVYKGVADGEYTVGLTFEEAALNYIKNGAPVEIIYPKEGVIAKADGMGIIKNASNKESAEKFVDYVTSKEVQQKLTSELNRRSILKDVSIDKTTGMKDLSEITIIKDDEEWSNAHKEDMLNEYKDIFTSN